MRKKVIPGVKCGLSFLSMLAGTDADKSMRYSFLLSFPFALFAFFSTLRWVLPW
jgi:undecaprenyl pyrophosphate phosphatase UppP